MNGLQKDKITIITEEIYRIFFILENLVRLSRGPHACQACGNVLEQVQLNDYIQISFCFDCREEKGVWIDEEAFEKLISGAGPQTERIGILARILRRLKRAARG